MRVPTRGNQTLDLILTNMPHVYNKHLVQTFPPFGLSDHLVVSLEPKPWSRHNTGSRRSFTRRDTRASRKCELGRYFGCIDWSILDSVQDCESKLQLFQDLVKIGLDSIMPLKTVKLHVNDPPWVTAEFKALIKARQKAFAQGDTEGYRHLRNITNRERKVWRRKIYASKVANLKTTKPSQWWREVKMIAGMTPATGGEDIRSHLHLDGIAAHSKELKELVIDFKKVKHHLDAVTVNSQELERVDSVKLLGVTITNTLQWNCHVLDVIQKANKRIYFLILLKHANVPVHDIICFYLTCIRPVLEYCAPLYHHALPDYLSKDIERIQKRTLSIISFDSIVSNPDHKLHHFLPPKNYCHYNLRRQRHFANPVMRTKRFSSTFLPSMCRR